MARRQRLKEEHSDEADEFIEQLRESAKDAEQAYLEQGFDKLAVRDRPTFDLFGDRKRKQRYTRKIRDEKQAEGSLLNAEEGAAIGRSSEDDSILSHDRRLPYGVSKPDIGIIETNKRGITLKIQFDGEIINFQYRCDCRYRAENKFRTPIERLNLMRDIGEKLLVLDGIDLIVFKKALLSLTPTMLKLHAKQMGYAG